MSLMGKLFAACGFGNKTPERVFSAPMTKGPGSVVSDGTRSGIFIDMTPVLGPVPTPVVVPPAPPVARVRVASSTPRTVRPAKRKRRQSRDVTEHQIMTLLFKSVNARTVKQVAQTLKFTPEYTSVILRDMHERGLVQHKRTRSRASNNRMVDHYLLDTAQRRLMLEDDTARRIDEATPVHIRLVK